MFFRFSPEPLQVVERQFPLLHGARASSSRQAGPLAEHHEIEQRITHQSVPPVQAS